MGKLTHCDLAKLVSRRLMEICDLTELPLNSLAKFTGLSYSTLRNAYKASSSPSIDSFARLCTPFAIELSDFFNPQKKLSIDNKILAELAIFKMAFFAPNVQQQVIENPISQTVGINAQLKRQREFIAQMIYSSDYFSTARTIEQMANDFAMKHQTVISPIRISMLLKKYIGLELLEKKVLPRTKRKADDLRRPYLYYKKGIN